MTKIPNSVNTENKPDWATHIGFNRQLKKLPDEERYAWIGKKGFLPTTNADRGETEQFIFGYPYFCFKDFNIIANL